MSRTDDLLKCQCGECADIRATGTENLLQSLRWDVDQKIVNHFDEHVWLKECFNDSGKRIGITDCCFVDNPCEWHSAIAALPERNKI